jgi:hypothetical protein
MKNIRIILALTVLVIASLACNALAGSKTNSTNPSDSSSGNQTGQATEAPPSSSSGSNIKTDFPMTADASNVTDMGGGSILYYTKMSQADVMKFYRDAYTAKGYKERTINTSVSDTTFSMVFDGDPSGKSVVIQSVNLGNGSSTVALRLEAIP